MGLREAILIAIVLLAAYVGYQLYRVSRIGRTPQAAPVPAEPKLTERIDVVSDEPGETGPDDEDEGDVYTIARPRPLPEPAIAAPPPDAFQHELEVRQLRRELEQQRAELTELRRSVDELRELLRAQKEQAEAGLATRGASPEYNEALVFARRGLDAETIAERCGITVAEAELVQSLARGQAGDAGQGT